MDVLSKVIPSAANSVYLEAINKRLNTVNLPIEQLMTIAANAHETMDDVGAIVEQDEWVYSDGVSMVCSAYVAAMYKAAGLFGDMEI